MGALFAPVELSEEDIAEVFKIEQPISEGDDNGSSGGAIEPGCPSQQGRRCCAELDFCADGSSALIAARAKSSNSGPRCGGRQRSGQVPGREGCVQPQAA